MIWIMLSIRPELSEAEFPSTLLQCFRIFFIISYHSRSPGLALSTRLRLDVYELPLLTVLGCLGLLDQDELGLGELQGRGHCKQAIWTRRLQMKYSQSICS